MVFRTFILAVLTAAFPAAAASQATSHTTPEGVKFDPMIAYVRLAPGQSHEEEFVLVNHSPRSAHFEVSLTDAKLEVETGRRLFPGVRTSPRGAGGWLEQPKQQMLSVPANKSITFKQKVTVPENTPSGTYFGAVLMELRSLGDGKNEQDATTVQKMGNEKIGMAVKLRTAVALMIHVDVRRPDDPAPAPDVEVVGDEVQPQQTAKPVQIAVKLRNHSKWEVKPGGAFIVLDKSGKALGKGLFDQVQLWPDETQFVKGTFAEKLPPGSYQAIAGLTMQDPFDPGGVGVYKPVTVRRKIDFVVPDAPAQQAAPAVKQAH